ncbi:MAG: DNA methyltransferase [Bradymonadaceae bacterium]
MSDNNRADFDDLPVDEQAIRDLPNLYGYDPDPSELEHISPILRHLAYPVDELNRDPENAKSHPDRNREVVENSLREYGQRDLIVVRAENRTIEAGNLRHKIVESMGHDWIAVSFEDDDPVTATKFALVDNRSAELAEWNDSLGDMLGALDETDVDLDGLGFGDDDLDSLDFSIEFGDDESGDEDGPEGPAPGPDENRAEELREKWGTEPGQVWSAGRHYVICADARTPAAFAELVDDEEVVSFTSPPYNAADAVNVHGNTHMDESKYEKVDPDDDLDDDEYLQLLTDVTASMLEFSTYAVLNLQMLANNKRVLIDYLHRFRDRFADVAIWYKEGSPPAMAERVMNASFEFLFFFGPEGAKRRIKTADFHGDVDNVLVGHGQRENDYADVHAATFDEHLPAWVIENFTQPDHWIVDPCAGTGTTLVAAENAGRRGIAGDLAPEYVAVILDRLENWGLECEKIE